METLQLRLGNLILDDHNQQVEVTTIWREGNSIRINPAVLDGNIDLYIQNPRPIPLSDDILDKSDLVNDGGLWKESKGNVEFLVKKTSHGYYIAVNEGKTHVGREFQFVHEVQNLYFDLVGEELDLNFITE